jgi:hypothetical protein
MRHHSSALYAGLTADCNGALAGLRRAPSGGAKSAKNGFRPGHAAKARAGKNYFMKSAAANNGRPLLGFVSLKIQPAAEHDARDDIVDNRDKKDKSGHGKKHCVHGRDIAQVLKEIFQVEHRIGRGEENARKRLFSRVQADECRERPRDRCLSARRLREMQA